MDAAGFASGRGAFDDATAATLLYTQTVAPGSPIRAADIVETRNAIDAMRVAFGVTPAFSGAAAPTGLIRASDFLPLVTALNAARQAAGRANFAYSGVSSPAVNGTVMYQHIAQLRDSLR